MRFLTVALIASAALIADDRWLIVKSGPFEVYAEDDHAARERLNDLEQFREAFANVIGRKDLKLNWPLRLLLFRKQPPVESGKIILGRDAYLAALPDRSGLTPDMEKALVHLLLDQNTNRMPEGIETGLAALFSTLEIAGTKVTLGAPVPASERSRDWARMHMLTTVPAFAGRTRVMLSNLAQSPDLVAAYHNAFEKPPSAIEKQLDEYIAAGKFDTADVFGRSVSVRDFHPQQLESDASRLGQADVLLAFDQTPRAEAEYTASHGPGSAEGLGMIALKKGNKDEARRLFASATESGSKSPRCWLNLALLETDVLKSRNDLRKAAELNPAWGEPWRQLSNTDPTPLQKITDLKKAAALEPRNSEYWRQLAQVATGANQFSDAAKAWSGAERAAANDAERERIRQIRLDMEGQRADFEAAERKRTAEEEARELERVKQQSMDEIHKAEEEARKKMNPNGEAVPKATVWIDELNGTGKTTGTLQRFDCLSQNSGRLVILGDDAKTTQLAVRNISQLGIDGGDKKLACGAQKEPRHVRVQFIVKDDKRLATAGDATVLEYR